MVLNLQNAEFLRSAVKREDFYRDNLPQVVFSGRSNVGKSSVINRILNRKNFARVGNSPGKTIHINYFRIDQKLYLVDLPGYGYAKVSRTEKDRWGKLIQIWFEDETLMSLGVMIVDIRHKPTDDDCIMATWFKSSGKPFVVVANKLDKIKKSEVEGSVQLIRDTLQLSDDVLVIPFSAEKGDGKQALIDRMVKSMDHNYKD